MSITIPAEWTQPSGCLGSTDVWFWTTASELSYGDVLGAPAESTICYPPSYKPTNGPAYTAASCPHGFTSAGSANAYSGSWSTVCCPRYADASSKSLPTGYNQAGDVTDHERTRSGAYTMSTWSATFGSFSMGCGLRYITDTSIHILNRTVTVFGPEGASLDSFTWTPVVPDTTQYGGATEIITTTLPATVVTSGGVVVPMTRDRSAVLYGMAIGVTNPVSIFLFAH